MKIINKIATVFLVIFGMLSAFAGETPSNPPSPTGKSAATLAGPGPPGPPAPIDGVGLLIFTLGAILLGIYVIYKHKLKTKASV